MIPEELSLSSLCANNASNSTTNVQPQEDESKRQEGKKGREYRGLKREAHASYDAHTMSISFPFSVRLSATPTSTRIEALQFHG
jgi:hypothetical protein